MIKKDKKILLGVISSAHGIKGEVIIKSFTKPEQNILKIPLIDQNNESINIKFIRNHPKTGLICKISDCLDRNQAETMLKTELYCIRENLPSLDNQEEFYFEDLYGLKVANKTGETIGHVSNIANYGAGDIIEITFITTKKSEFFPFTKEHFPEIKQDFITFIMPDMMPE